MSGFLNFTREKQIKKVIELDVDSIVPNPNQPRTDFSESDISALSDSIAQNGILQPLSVRKCGDSYELIAGERRLRAAKMCGLRTVPCIIHDMSDRESAILALVENIQRQDLSFFDEAAAIEKLITHYGMTQEDAAAKGLIDLRDALAAEKYGKPPKSLIVILGHSGAAYRRKDGVLVCPISLLRA